MGTERARALDSDQNRAPPAVRTSACMRPGVRMRQTRMTGDQHREPNASADCRLATARRVIAEDRRGDSRDEIVKG